MQHIEARVDIARRNPGGADDGWVDEAWFLAEPMQGLSPGVEVGPEHRKACAHAIGLGPGGEAVDVNGLAEALPYPDGALAFVVANHVLEHCTDPVDVLREWRRALRPGGLVGVVTPDSRHVSTFSLNPEHKHVTTPEVLREWFARAGYEILKEATPVPGWSCGVIARVTSDLAAETGRLRTHEAHSVPQHDASSVAFPRVAVIYDTSLRSDTTGGYCLRALQQTAEVEHFPPERLADLSADYDLYLCVDDGLDYPFPDDLHPSVFWAIDTHLSPSRALRRARDHDFVFAAQKEGAEQLRAEGIAHCEWLPLACDPEIHRHLEAEKRWDVAFVGHMVGEARTKLLEQVQRRFPNSFVGQVPHTEMAEVYSRARIVINACLANDLNMRVFEAMSCGAMLITNHLQDNGQEELFQDRVHLVEYRTPEEALELIAYYLAHEEEREQIAQAGHAEVIAKHTYRHRMERLLARMGEFVSSEAYRSRPVPAPAPSPSHDRQYFHWARPDLLELIPREARRVLDVGCAAGVLGESVKRRQACEVVGIELSPMAAAEARTRLDRVIEGDAETLDLSELGSFDAIVCGDVLEHLRDPGATLRKLRGLLAPEGTLIASFPNARHMDVVQQLIEGNWTYEPAGLLDRDHLRFFTRRSAEQLLDDCDFDLAEVRAVPGSGYAGWEQAGRPGGLEAGRLALTGLSSEEAQEFFVGQWLITARPAPRGEWGLTSIVILTWNQLPYTQRCLDSLRKHTHLPYELIVVDNGSTDGTREWLESQSDVRLIANPTNLGFPKGANQGLRAAKGDNLLLLNNDTLLTPGWLRRLLTHLHSSSEVGLVGPVSNFVSGEQQISVPYQNLVQLDGFAWEWGKAQRGRTRETDRLVGFCLAMKREVVDRIGLLDEQFEVGCYEDDDLCRRAAAAGYRLLICEDAFVHHFGGRTFIGSGMSFSQIMQENARRFREKWPEATPPELSAPAPSPTTRAWQIGLHPAGGLLLETKAPAISLCMIVREEEPRIAQCLESIRPYVDEMVVVDTGSRDRTPEIAASLGATVIRSQWEDSFSAARNLSLNQATGEWILWLDADDVVPRESGEMLRRLVEQAEANTLGFVAQVHCPAGPGEQGETVVDHVKLFRNRPDLRFELRIHAQILPSIRRAGGEIARAPLHVLHANYDHSPEGQRRKRERDARLLALDLQENPEHPFVHFNVGMTALHEKDLPRAITHLRKSIDLSAPQDSQVRKAYALLASAHRALGQGQEALAVSAEARAIYPEDPELLFNEALAHQLAGDLREAERTFLALLNGASKSGDYLASVDTGITSYKARHNLGAVYQQLGEAQRARECWEQVLAECPEFVPSWLALAELLTPEGGTRLEQLATQAEARELRAVAAVMRGRQAMQVQDLLGAESQFRQAVSADPDLVEGHRFLSHALLQRGERLEVEQVLRRLLALCPEDGEAYHNLGSLLMEQGRAAEAVHCYQQSLLYRPGNAATLELLHQAMEAARGPRPTAQTRPPGPRAPEEMLRAPGGRPPQP